MAMDTTVADIREELSNARSPQPQWLKIEDAVHYCGLSRSKIYQLLESKVRSVCLREKDKLRGTRLIWRPSLDAYFAKYEGKKSERPKNAPTGNKKEKAPVTRTETSNLGTL
jgi:hypothetical protein